MGGEGGGCDCEGKQRCPLETSPLLRHARWKGAGDLTTSKHASFVLLSNGEAGPNDHRGGRKYAA